MLEELIEKLNSIESQVSQLIELQLQQTNNLTSFKDVAKYLGKTPRTIRTYIKENKFLPNKHYVKDANGKTVFIPKAIVEFRNGDVDSVTEDTIDSKPIKVMHPVATSILRGVA